jgi:hypothetical protein
MAVELAREGLARLLKESGDLFGVIDPVNRPESLDLIFQHDPESLVLFKGRVEEDLIPLLPRVVRLVSGCPFTEAFLDGQGNGWGIMFKTFGKEHLIDVLADLLLMTNVTLPDKRTAWFRFYDPYILETMLLHWNPEQLSTLYGSRVAFFLVEKPINQNWTLFEKPEGLPEKSKSILSLSPEFIEQLDQAHYALFISELTLHCREEYFPHASEDDASKIAEAVRLMVQTAEENGLVTMDHIVRFVEIAAMHGRNFHLTEEAATILHSHYSHPSRKLEALEQYMQRVPAPIGTNLFYS